MDDSQLRADLAQAKRAAQANGQALSEKVAELAYARPMADAAHLVAKLWDAAIKAGRQYSHPSMSFVAALDMLLAAHQATTPSQVPSSHVIVERAELERLRAIAAAAYELAEGDCPSWFGLAIDKLRVALGTDA